MPETLLRTKLHVPQLRPNLVTRARLIERLDQRLGQNKGFAPSLVLISSPAGAGKTTLLSQFAAGFQQQVAWLSLDESDDDPNRFWSYLITACQSVLAEVGQSALALLNTSQPLPDEAIPTLLINDFVAQERTLILILDDYHVVQNPTIHKSVSFLLEHLPAILHLVIATRVDPPWPLARYRAHHQLVEIRARDLRFNPEEAAEFLNQTMALNLSAEDVAALEARTEGWVAGLQLAAIAMQSPQQGRDRTAFVQSFTGSHLYVAEYLVEEILHQQPENVQTFLLHTSILERLNAELCDAVTGRQDGQTILPTLHRANLFMIPLDDKGRWFRYHHLFADLLQASLLQTVPADAIDKLHKRAARWYEQNGFAHEAIKHALRAKDFERVSSLVEEEARAMMFTGRARTLKNWLASLPDESFQTNPRLQIYRLWIDLMQEKSDLSANALLEKEAMLRSLPPSPENAKLQVELMAILARFVAFSGNTARAIQLAEEALVRLPESEVALRARAHSALAVAYWIEGDVWKARQAHDQCVSLAEEVGNYSLAAHARMMMALNQTDHGRLHEAARTYQSIIDLGEQSGQKIFFPAGQGYIGLAGIHLEWNELETAEDYLQRGMALCRQGGLAGLSTGHTLKARLRQARGDFQGALAELDRLGETGVDPTGTARSILLRLAMDRVDEAARLAGPWLRASDEGPSSPRPPLLISEIIRITVAQLFIAQGQLGEAWRLLDAALATAGPGGRAGRLTEIYLFQALIRQKQNRGEVTPEARTLFERALELAEPEGYALLFLEQDSDVRPLLAVVITHQDAAARLKQYAQKLLQACRRDAIPDQALSSGGASALVGALTQREMEVLQLLAIGDPNRVIAGKLVITVRTVKKHVTNILGKLGASNRTQAVARARELGLISQD
jgi:LuxR family maltose regulon positive regulatory protein